MTTIKEDYCSKELSLLLDKKGFDGYSTPHSKLILSGLIPHSVAMKWLREVYKLHIEPHIQSYKNYNGNIYNLDGELLLGFSGESPEQACEAAIKYCLENLI